MANTIHNNTNINSNAAGGISIDGFNTLTATVIGNTFSNNINQNAIGFFTGAGGLSAPNGQVIVQFNDNTLTNNDSFTLDFYGTENTACLTLSGNISDGSANPSYIFTRETGANTCTLAPCNYQTLNVGNVDVTEGDLVTIVESCGGSICD